MNEQALTRRIHDWENQLLDLGRRNRMISYRENRRSTLSILQPGFEELYRRLVTEGEELSFQRPLERETDARVFAVLQLLDRLADPVEVLVGDIQTPGHAAAGGAPADTRLTLKNLRDKARLAQSEQGVNSLYLTFGFVQWHEPGKDEWLRSPLLLVPVTLMVRNLHAPYTLCRHEEDAVVNPTLTYLFARDYDLHLPEFDADEDDLADFIARVETLLDAHGWRVERACSLGLLSFQKISMYHDLVRHEAQLRENPIVRAFAGERNAVCTPDMSHILLDHDRLPARETYQVLPADSSQQDAIALSRAGISFVMQGPPGTGKSQTIANIIAQALADGKRVLFVSEKAAALDVVLRRLEDARLNDFCLALHSHKANKKDVLEQLGRNLDMPRMRVRDEDIDALTRLDMLREQLLSYTAQAHQDIPPLEKSFYDGAGVLAELEHVPDVPFPLPDVMTVDREQLIRLAMLLGAVDRASIALGDAAKDCPWLHYQGAVPDAAAMRELRQCLLGAVRCLNELSGLHLGDAAFLDAASLEGMAAFAPIHAHAVACVLLPDAWMTRDTQVEKECIRRLQQQSARLKGLQEALPPAMASAGGMDAAALLNELEDAMRQVQTLLLPDVWPDEIVPRLSAMQTDLLRLADTWSTLSGALDELQRRWSVSFRDEGAAVSHALTLCRAMQTPHALTREDLAADSAIDVGKLRDAVRRSRETRAGLLVRYDEAALDLADADALCAAMEPAVRELGALAEESDLSALDAAAQTAQSAIARVHAVLSDAQVGGAFRQCRLPLPATVEQADDQRQALQKLAGVSLPDAWQTPAARRAARELLNQGIETATAAQTIARRVQGYLNRAHIALDAAALTREQMDALRICHQGIPGAESLLRHCTQDATYALLDDLAEHAARMQAAAGDVAAARKRYHIAADWTDEGLLALLDGMEKRLTLTSVPAWWTENREEGVALLKSLQEQSDALGASRKALAEDWTEGVFALDCDALHTRFTKAYGNVFKHLMSGYAQDVRRVQALSRAPERRLSDEQIIQLLSTLKQYKKDLKAYRTAATKAQKTLGLSAAPAEGELSALCRQAEDFARLCAALGSEGDARRFLEDGGLVSLLAALRVQSREKTWFAGQSQAKLRLGDAYAAEKTDVHRVREAMQALRTLQPYMPDEKHLLALVSRPQPAFTPVAEDMDSLHIRLTWLNDHHDALLQAAGGTELSALQNAREQLTTIENVIRLIGEDAALHLCRQGASMPRQVGVCLQALADVCQVRPIAERLLPAEDAGLLPLSALLNALTRTADAIRAMQRAAAPLLTHRRTADSATPKELLADLQHLCRLQEDRARIQTMTAAGHLSDAWQNQEPDWASIEGRLDLVHALQGLLAGDASPALLHDLAQGAAPWDAARLMHLQTAWEEAQRLEMLYPPLHAETPLSGNLVDIQLAAEAADAVRRILTELEALSGDGSPAVNGSPAGGSLSYTDACRHLRDLSAWRESRERFADTLERVRAIMPEVPLDADSDWESILLLFDHLDAVKAAERTRALPAPLLTWLTGRLPDTPADAMCGAVQTLIDTRGDILRLLNDFAGMGTLAAQPLRQLHFFLTRCEAELPLLDGCLELHARQSDCAKAGLGNFLTRAETAGVQTGGLQDAFMRSFFTAFVRRAAGELPAVSAFRARGHEEAVDAFCALDDRQTVVAQARIREKLIRSMPVRTVASHASDELSILLHEMNKRRAIMPLRRLFRSIPNLLLRLKPCLMMSPLSVAHFLEADTYRFDLVIFDEASQIFPQDAIGALFRGKQIVIAGDSKQLPPTNFFSAGMTAGEEDEEEDEYTVYDSILEEASAVLPNQSLLWHYRSRQEALIAFSNQEIYSRRLITFPSCVMGRADAGLEYIHVQGGVYVDRCNEREAERIVELVADHIARHPERSLGVIAFSESQQRTIEHALVAWRTAHPEQEGFFAEEKDEPFFVKNLENVQGDERDTIIFSIGYGKNERGRMYMRFGPLGQQGGERRLNVAITRAKENIKLVGSILPEDIDLRKTAAEGVRMLRAYIRFAMQGSAALRPAEPLREGDDALVHTVARFLRGQGYRVRLDEGSSAYTVDIAVEHPNDPGCILAGVECDGFIYRSARTVRDRDHLRPAQMRRMHWRMYRVWSAAWLRDPDTEKARLLSFLESALNGTDAALPPRIETTVDDILTEDAASTAAGDGIPLYREFTRKDAKKLLPLTTEAKFPAAIRAILRVEQPMHWGMLLHRIADLMELPRVTPRVREGVERALSTGMQQEIAREGDWLRLLPCPAVVLRRSPLNGAHRTIDHISPGEVREGMLHVLRSAIGITEAELLSETAAIFGFERMGNRIRQRMEETLQALLRSGLVTLADGKVLLKEA